MDKSRWIKTIKRGGIVALSIVLGFIAVVILCLGAAAIPEQSLTPLPYTWLMIAIRLMGYGGLYTYYRSHRYAPLAVSVLAVSYECYLFTLYQSAMEGLLW